MLFIHYPLPSLLQAVHAGEFKPSACTWTLMTRAELLPPFGEFYEEIARVNRKELPATVAFDYFTTLTQVADMLTTNTLPQNEGYPQLL